MNLIQRSDMELGAYVALSNSPFMKHTSYGQRTRTVVERIRFLKDAINMCDRVMAPTKLNRDLLIRNGINPGLIQLSPYGMDISDIATAPRSPVNPPVLRIGYIGSLARHKGVDTLIKAFKGIPEMTMPAELKIYGEPSRDPQYTQELRGLAGADERISFAGTFEGEKIGWVFSEMDVLVVPSRWYENTPLVVYSAFAAGTPVVATNLGGLSEAIEHGKNGLLFEMDDARDLNEQLLRFHFEPDLLARLREGIEPVRTAEDSVDELEQLYRELLAPGTHRALAPGEGGKTAL